MHFGILGLIASSSYAISGYIWLYSNFIPQGHPRCHVVSRVLSLHRMVPRLPRVLSASQEFIPVATTRPETILGDSAVCVHPEVGTGWKCWEYVGIMSPQCGNHQAPNISQPHLFNFFNWETLTLYTQHLGTWGVGFFGTLTKKKLETV